MQTGIWELVSIPAFGTREINKLNQEVTSASTVTGYEPGSRYHLCLLINSVAAYLHCEFQLRLLARKKLVFLVRI